MSFGFAVGDFVAVGKLIVDITDCLSDAGGAKSEYQECIRELNALQSTLRHLDTLQSGDVPSKTLDSIKYTALSCLYPLEAFLGKTRKYEKFLGTRDNNKALRSTFAKLQWGLGQKDEVRRLQQYLNIHVGTINILLTTYGFEKIDISSSKAAAENLRIEERLENTRGIIQSIKDSIDGQRLAIQSTHSLVSRLVQLITGEIKSTFESFGEMIARTCVSTQQIYGVVLEIKETLLPVDTRWTFFQAPLVVEDALGYKFPVPSEYDYSTLVTIIQHRFKSGEGSLEVQAGNYELFKTRSSKELVSEKMRLLPGTAITMAIVIDSQVLEDEVCPMPHCGSTSTAAALGGGRTCCECNVWFDRAAKKHQTFQNLLDALTKIESPSMTENITKDQSILQQAENEHLPSKSSFLAFKNVRWTIEDDFDFEDDRPETHPFTPENLSKSEDPNLPDFKTAYEFVTSVKECYVDKPETYKYFLSLMGGFKKGRYSHHKVFDAVKIFFADQPSLICEFEAFMPKRHTINPTEDEMEPSTTSFPPDSPRERSKDTAKRKQQDLDTYSDATLKFTKKRRKSEPRSYVSDLDQVDDFIDGFYGEQMSS